MTGAEGSQTKTAERPRETPGRRLRRARERRELSVTTVASALHLNRGVVESLENDDYEKLPPLTFVKGYLRVYARYLSLPEAEVLGAFDRLGMREEARPLGGRPAGQTGRESAMRRPSPLPWLLMLLAAVGLAAAGYLWYREGSMAILTSLWSPSEPVVSESTPPGELAAADDPESSSTEPAPAQAAANNKEPAANSGETVPLAVLAPLVPEPPRVAAIPVSESTAPASAQQRPATQQPAQPSQETATDGTGPATAPVADGPASPAAGQAQEAPATGDGVADASQDEAPTAEEGFDTLEFRFQGESWVEVRDARGERLLFGLVSEPGTRELEGQPPFEIVVGSVNQVSLTRNGVAVDLSAQARGQVARFTLDEQN